MLARLLVTLVKLYQRAVSPLLRLTAGNVCRFEPSCSHYAVACLQAHGALRGSLLSIVRVCKCHPFHAGGYDPPPLPRPRDASKITTACSSTTATSKLPSLRSGSLEHGKADVGPCYPHGTLPS